LHRPPRPTHEQGPSSHRADKSLPSNPSVFVLARRAQPSPSFDDGPGVPTYISVLPWTSGIFVSLATTPAGPSHRRRPRRLAPRTCQPTARAAQSSFGCPGPGSRGSRKRSPLWVGRLRSCRLPDARCSGRGREAREGVRWRWLAQFLTAPAQTIQATPVRPGPLPTPPNHSSCLPFLSSRSLVIPPLPTLLVCSSSGSTSSPPPSTLPPRRSFIDPSPWCRLRPRHHSVYFYRGAVSCPSETLASRVPPCSSLPGRNWLGSFPRGEYNARPSHVF